MGSRSSIPSAGWAMLREKLKSHANGKAGKDERPSKQFWSIARTINWGYLWRRILGVSCLALTLTAASTAVTIAGYNAQLPAGAIKGNWIPARGTQLSITVGSQTAPQTTPLESLRRVTYRAVDRNGKKHTFPLGSDMLGTYGLPAAIFLIWELIDILEMLGSTRRIRRAMLPLNELALKAESLGNATLTDFDKIETLEQAIERASVDAPSVSTGDQDLASIEVALNRLLRQMQEAKLQQMRFVNDASHELRTPIAVIQGYVNMLDRWGKDDPAVLEESIESIKTESEHMQELVEQLLFLARGDAGRTALNRTRIDLAALVREVCEESEMIDRERAYCIGIADTGESAPIEANVDIALIKQAVRIMVQNAAKYSPADSTITIGARHTDEGAALSIEDEGIGMSGQAARRAFERFYRADNARESGATGSGLGLSIAKWIVDQHGGSIAVDSVEGVGTRFTITLPPA